jgi:hypothetical protein
VSEHVDHENVPQKGQEVLAEERRTEAVKLRIAGHSYRHIAKQLGISLAQAHKDVQTVLKRTRDEADEVADEARDIDLARIDQGLKTVLEFLESAKDDELKLKAIDRLVRLQERRAKLLGLDAPAKGELSGPSGGPIPVAQTSATPAEAARLIREAFGAHAMRKDSDEADAGNAGPEDPNQVSGDPSVH